MKVSVVIPAYNASKTIADALASLQSQEFSQWEAIVVDDGSSDATPIIAAEFAAQDRRICTVSQRQGGGAAARNTGITLTRYDWLLFLDADDLILPHHLEQMTSVLAADPGLDAVHCGWARVSPDGALMDQRYRPPAGDLFHAFARFPAFIVHACVVRRSLVEAVGKFDPSLRTCSDWDLWQRIARTGACFGAVLDILAHYRMQPNSASLDSQQMLIDGLRVIAQGYAPDKRVREPHPAHSNGEEADDMARAQFARLCWVAGLMLGRGEDARSLLKVLGNVREPGLDPRVVAETIFDAAPLPTCRPPQAWANLWRDIEQVIEEFLVALEIHSLAPGLARRTQVILESMILGHSQQLLPLAVGRTYGIRLDVTESLHDVRTPNSIERLHSIVELEGQPIGTIELPVCENMVPAYVFADAIAAELAWPIIGRFFEHTIYPFLRVEQKGTGIALYRETLCLLEEFVEERENGAFWKRVHDHIGWTVFLQEFWGRPDWPRERFDDPQVMENKGPCYRVDEAVLTVEVSEELPDVETESKRREIDVLAMVGGVAIGVVTVPFEQNVLHAQRIRMALIREGGYELCRVAVREGLLGTSLTEPIPLRERLAAAAVASAQRNGKILPYECSTFLASEGAAALRRALTSWGQGTVFGRRRHGTMGTSSSRRAVFPAATVRALADAAAVSGDPVINFPLIDKPPERIVYAPDVIWQQLLRPQSSPSESRPEYAGDDLQDLYLRTRGTADGQPNPWRYANLYEQTKGERLLALLPLSPISQALELTATESPFTMQLASRVGDLTVACLSQMVLEQSIRLYGDLSNIHLCALDPCKDDFASRFDLIVCRDVLYYFDKQALKDIVRRLVNALQPGGYFIAVHANLVVDEPERTGFDWDFPCGAKVISETLGKIRSLRLIKEFRDPLYRIQLFQRTSRLSFLSRFRTPETTESTRFTAPPLEMGAHLLWNGGAPRASSASQGVLTSRLPILMYHRVAPAGSRTGARYRVAPEGFAEQLQYLRNAGFYSVRLEDWHKAMTTQCPLPGRAVLLTFDDGCLDFWTYAWPALKCYNFSALVFLVADQIGRTNRWDQAYEEAVPLLGWEEIRRLQDAGIEFGSHSASHRPLTALSPQDIVGEGARSRMILESGLNLPVAAFAYPYGAEDRVVQHLIGGCGYLFGLSTRYGLSEFDNPLLSLPRVEVTGFDRLPAFITKLSI